MFSLKDLSVPSILVLESGPSWKSRGAVLNYRAKAEVAGHTEGWAPLPLQTCGYLQQLLPAEPACNLPFCHL